MRKAIREHLKAHYSTYVMVTNIMVAVGSGVLGVLGLLSSYVSVPVLITNAAIFGIIAAIGKFGNEQLEDLPLVEKVECQVEGREDCK